MRALSAVLDWAIQSLIPHYERLDFDADFRAPQPKAAPHGLLHAPVISSK